MKRAAMAGYPQGFQSLLWLTLATMLLSGSWLLPLTLQMRLGLELPAFTVTAHRALAATIHGSAAFALLMLLGALAAVHMRAGLQRQQLRTTGLLLLAAMLALIVSALVLYYSGHEQLSAVASVTHVLSAAATTVLLIIHAVAGRQLHAPRPQGRTWPVPRTTYL
jgi:hypothetical protein